ncbi:MAG: hypothetical protein ABIJ84_04350 [bacterium]
MKPKIQEKEKVIGLRKKGYTYNEILATIPVAKSSLSLWLKDFPLTEYEKQYLKTRIDKNISLGRIRAAATIKQGRIKRDKAIFLEAKSEFNDLIKSPFFQVGLALYWAEGTKRSYVFQFVNSDPDMITLMIRWIQEFFYIPKEKIFTRLYIHKPYAHERCEEYWSKKINIPLNQFKKTIYKPTRLGIKKDQIIKGA